MILIKHEIYFNDRPLLYLKIKNGKIEALFGKKSKRACDK